MKTFLVLLAAVLSSPSLAADLPAKARLVSPPVESWSGLYVGLQGGWNLGAFGPVFGSGEESTKVNLDDNNPFVGGHIGYLIQKGNFVIGPELGVQYWDHKSRAEMVPGIAASTVQTKMDWVAYANVRAGLTIFSPNTLAYVTGGVAWSHFRGELINLADLNTVNEQSVLGWNVGAGVEFKINEYLVFGGEYRHYDFGKVSALNPALALSLGGLDKLTVDQAMARLSYRLN